MTTDPIPAGARPAAAGGPERSRGGGALVPAAAASAGAGAVHAAAIGVHAELPGMVRLFVVAAVVQIGAALVALVRPGHRSAAALAIVNVGAVGFWIVTRTAGIGAIDGLTDAEAVGLADGLAALLATLSVLGSALALRDHPLPRWPVPVAGIAVVALAVPGMVAAADHTAHDHGGGSGHDHADDGHGATAAAGSPADAAHDDDHHDDNGDDHHGDRDDQHDDGHDDQHDDGHGATAAAGSPADAAHDDDHGDHGDDGDGAADRAVADAPWPRPWDPATDPVDFSGVPGVTADQQRRAERLVADTLEVLPRFADVTTVTELGFRSIGDAATGHEHYVNLAYLFDEHELDPRYPESLVYEVDGSDRTLVSAMYIVADTPIDDPDLVDFGGPLMQWHVHDNLCWGSDDAGNPVVAAVTDDHGGVCPEGTVLAGGENPMVHVWIAPHECGPFAALEGHGAGTAAADEAERTDRCAHDHGDDHADQHDDHADQHDDQHDDHERVTESAAGRSYDPALPIDLGGIDGVTPEQQAFAENLVAVTLRYLPKWSDPAVAEAAGFRSIGDGDTGHEHYIQWDWIDDDVWLDPLAPESLVYEPRPDGTKELVSAMYMLPSDVPLAEVPDWGGELMQWHVHEDLCFTDDPEAPQVAAVVAVGAPCPDGLIAMDPAPMIHVWIRPHECGPFAALDGVGAGQVLPDEEHRCDHVHGAHDH